MKFNVHLYVGARVQIQGIDAARPPNDKARSDCNPDDFFGSGDSTECAVWDEAPDLGALVDEIDEEGDVGKTTYVALEGATVYLNN